MRVAVAGASGFIGSAFVKACSDEGVSAIPLARSRNGSPRAEFAALSEYARGLGAEVLVHLAETRDVAAAESLGDAYIEQSVANAKSLLSGGFAKVIYASSAVVYGDGVSTPRRPDERIEPKGVYARAKAAVERLICEHSKGVVVRLANVYGRGMAPTNVIGDILSQIPGNDPVFVRDASPIRDFIEVTDVASGLLSMTLGSATGVYNLGSGRGCAVSDIVEICCELSGQSGRPVISTSPSGRASALILDMALTREQFGWQSSVSLRDGLQALLTTGR